MSLSVRERRQLWSFFFKSCRNEALLSAAVSLPNAEGHDAPQIEKERTSSEAMTPMASRPSGFRNGSMDPAIDTVPSTHTTNDAACSAFSSMSTSPSNTSLAKSRTTATAQACAVR